jgi:hypothetical protein
MDDLICDLEGNDSVMSYDYLKKTDSVRARGGISRPRLHLLEAMYRRTAYSDVQGREISLLYIVCDP